MKNHLELMRAKIWLAEQSTASEQQSQPINCQSRFLALSVNSAPIDTDVDLGTPTFLKLHMDAEEWKPAVNTAQYMEIRI